MDRVQSIGAFCCLVLTLGAKAQAAPPLPNETASGSVDRSATIQSGHNTRVPSHGTQSPVPSPGMSVAPKALELLPTSHGVTADMAPAPTPVSAPDQTDKPTEHAADASSTLALTPETSEATSSRAPTALPACSNDALETYAKRRAFTLWLMEQRERRKFESEVEYEMRRREFTERLLRERAKLNELDLRQFDLEVEDYVRRREFTERLQAEHDKRTVQSFFQSIELEEKKRAFTRRLIQNRGNVSRSTAAGSSPAPTPPTTE